MAFKKSSEYCKKEQSESEGRRGCDRGTLETNAEKNFIVTTFNYVFSSC